MSQRLWGRSQISESLSKAAALRSARTSGVACGKEFARHIGVYSFATALFLAAPILCRGQAIITTIAGNGSIGFGGDGGPGTSATLGFPSGVATDANGNVYIADALNQRIRKVDSSGVISTVAGNGLPFFSGDGGPATSASISLCASAQHAGIAVDTQGNLYIADCANNRIRKVNSSGIITTVAGIGGFTALSGDGGPATSANLGFPFGVTVDGSGNIYIADTGNGRVRKVDTSGIITTVAGTTNGFNLGDGGLATSAQLANPRDVAVDSAGNLYIADYGNSRIRKVNTSGTITSVAIPGALSASGLALDSTGNLYLTGGSCVYKFDTAGKYTCVAGGGVNIPGDGGPPTSAGLGSVTDVDINSAGNIIFSDLAESRVRKVTAGPACAVTLSSAGQAFPASGGSATVVITTPQGCAWTVTATPSWIVLIGASSGSGSTTLTYVALPNPGADRTGTLTISGVNLALEQTSTTITGLVNVGSLPHFASAGTWATLFSYVNLGTTSAQARTSFFGDSGISIPLALTFPQLAASAGTLFAPTFDRTLNPGASLLFSSTGPDSTPVATGEAQLMATGNVGGFAIFSDPLLKWNAVVPLETRNAASYLLAFDNTGALGTGMALENPTANAAAIHIVIRDDAGAQLGTATINLPANGHKSFVLSTDYPVTISKRGTVEFDTPSGGQIGVLGLRANGPALTTLPVLAAVGTGGGTIAHVTYNGGFSTLITLVNTGAAQASATLKFFDGAGNPLVIPLSLPQSGTNLTAATLTRTLAAGATLLVSIQGQSSLTEIEGSALLTTDGNVSGFGIFNWTTFGQEASVPLEARSAGSYVLIFDNTGGLATGVAVANVDTHSANITVKVKDDTGALLQTTTLSLNAQGHTSFLLGDAYPASAAKRGTVEFVTPPSGRISLIGLRAKTDGTLTSIPVLAP